MRGFILVLMSGRRTNLTLRGLSALCVLLYFLLTIVSHLPRLHSFIHKDANSEQHHCVLTLIANNQVLLSDSKIVVCPNPVIVSEFKPSAIENFKSVEHSANFSRAPPFNS